MQHNQAPHNVFQEFETLEDELRAFVAERGTTNQMPKHSQLAVNGRSDLATAIHRHGGSGVVASRLGLQMSQDHLPDHYWQDPDVMERELRACIEEHGAADTMLTWAQLVVCGRSDLVNGIKKYHGGIRAVTAALGLKPGRNPPSAKPRAYWREWENVEAEMPAVSEACGVPGQIPLRSQLQANGYTTLSSVISDEYGGMHEFAKRLTCVTR